MSFGSMGAFNRGGGSGSGGGADVTAPILTNGYATETGPTTADWGVDTDEITGTIFHVSTATADEPSSANVIAGLNASGVATPNASVAVVAPAGTKTGSVTGLADGTTYYPWFVHRDTYGNISDVASGDPYITDTIDVTPPVLVTGTPLSLSTTSARFPVHTDTLEGFLYFKLVAGSTPPSVANVVSGTGGFFNTNTAVGAIADITQDVTGMTPGQAYYPYWVQDDAAGNRSALASGEPITLAGISNQTVYQGAKTLANVKGLKPLNADGEEVNVLSLDSVQSGVGTGWARDATTNSLYRSTLTSTDSHGAVLRVTTTLGQVDLTLSTTGTDPDGNNMAVSYSVSNMTELVAAWQTTNLAFGDNILLRTGEGIYNPTYSLALRPNMAAGLDGGPWVPPSLYDASQPDKGYDLDTANFVKVTKHYGADPVIGQLSINGQITQAQHIRLTNLKFHYTPLAFIPAPGNTYTLSALTITLNLAHRVAIDNCEIWSTADGLPAEQGQIYSGIAVGDGEFWIQDNYIHDVAYAIAASKCAAKIIGNRIQRWWGGALQVNLQAGAVIAWNEVTDVRNFDRSYMEVHPDFLQYDDGALGPTSDRSGVRIICNRFDIGDYPFNETGAQGIYGGPNTGIALNPFFITDTLWTKGAASWTITGGRAVATSAASGVILSQAITLIPGQQYELSWTIPAASASPAMVYAGAIMPRITGGTTVNGTARSAAGTYNERFTAVTGNTTLEFVTVGTTNLRIETALLFRPLTDAVIAGNLVVAQAFHVFYLGHIKDSLIYHNTLLMDPTQGVEGWFRFEFATDNIVTKNIFEQYFDVNPFSPSTFTDNTAVLIANYDDEIADPVNGADITDLATQYDVKVGSTSDLNDRGANSRYIDWDNRTHDFPYEETSTEPAFIRVFPGAVYVAG